MIRIVFVFVLCLLSQALCAQTPLPVTDDYAVTTGAERTADYLPLLHDKRVACVVNQTSIIGKRHLVDSLQSIGVNITTIFAPEHGFRGDLADGVHVHDYKDSISGINVISLFGKSFKPTSQDLKNCDVVIFDIQDVGVRFYTYISTMHYIMEACAENNIPLLIFDRPNPNGHYVDGPVLNAAKPSFVGMHPIPIVHGLTIGELALMINGEKWLKDSLHCDLTIIPCQHWDHGMLYQLPVKPSPNLTSMESVYLYPSLGLFEGTVISVGRGTTTPFEMIGHPQIKDTSFSFTPEPIKGMSDNPPLKGQKCYGYNFKSFASDYLRFNGQVFLYWMSELYCEMDTNPAVPYFSNAATFDRLAGNSTLREQIMKGVSVEKIRASWQPELITYKTLRKKYLLYKDFE